MDGLTPESLILIVAVGSALVGGLLTWIISYASGGKQHHYQPTVRAAQDRTEVSASVSEQELLSVSRTKRGKPAIFIQGQRYRHMREIADPQVVRETVEALKAVLAFAEDWLPSTSQRSTQPSSAMSTVDQQTLLQKLHQAPPSSSITPPGLPGGPTLRTPGRLLDPLTFVDEIDSLVQQRLSEQPNLAGRFIRLTSGKAGGLRIYVDRQIFDAVSDITDPQVRALIQDAIHEWEDS